MTEFEISALIGYWRCGASVEQIRLLTDLSLETIERVIANYDNKKQAA